MINCIQYNLENGLRIVSQANILYMYLGVFKTIRIRKSDPKYPISESEISEKLDIRNSDIRIFRIRIVIFKIFGYFGYRKFNFHFFSDIRISENIRSIRKYPKYPKISEISEKYPKIYIRISETIQNIRFRI
ncbi:hypothetical protein HanPI659440_Chr15g0607671 [Helianthus annuus]|nr:hypothetical protein HanPI659440_Chr15g0607671 [Helianthus annuus]